MKRLLDLAACARFTLTAFTGKTMWRSNIIFKYEKCSGARPASKTGNVIDQEWL